jgi:hypothetical protein
MLVFARFAVEAEGAFATCHCLTLPESEPGYFLARRDTGELTRRSDGSSPSRYRRPVNVDQT